MNNNEKFIHVNTRTSHKRLESMVLYALHYALRDIEILSQHAVIVDNKLFLIDAYIPALNLAIEVDEPHHSYQVAGDQNRQHLISEQLGCEFIRINCSESIYSQIDAIVDHVRQANLEPWYYQPPMLSLRDGKYSQEHIEKLEEKNIPELMSAFAEELKKEGNNVREGSIRGIPNPGNGELGFLVERNGITFAIYARASGRVNVRVMEFTPKISDNVKRQLHERQVKNGTPRFYALPDNKNAYEDKDEAKTKFYEFISLACL